VPGLPKVRFYQAWNEPNISEHLTPQYEGQAEAAAPHYRLMLNAFYDAVKAVSSDNVVITAGTAPYGDPPGRKRTRPLTFWRTVLCLARDGQGFSATQCPTKASFDVLAHHPINTTDAPEVPAVDPDDATIADFGEVADTLRAAERAGTTGTGGTHPLWATEIWWDSQPPDPSGVPLQRHARWIEQSLYLLSKQGASAVFYLAVQDVPSQNPIANRAESAGLFKADGSPKPAFTAFRFPFVTDRKSKRKLIAWGKAPVAGKLKIQRRAGKGWRKVKSVQVAAGATFKTRIKGKKKQSFRASVAGEKSLVWTQR
jgi:hypothetical protein